MDYRRTYESAASTFCDLVSRLPAESWGQAGLGDWSLRDLLGHTVSSALRQVPRVLTSPAATLNIVSPEGYWAFARTAPPQIYAEAVAASSRDAWATGQLLGPENLDLVRDLAHQATQALDAVGDEEVVATAVGGMRVRDWMQTRTFELVVHGLDAAQAANVPIEFAAEPVAEALTLAAGVAAAIGDGPVVLRALTGRAALPNGFSVV